MNIKFLFPLFNQGLAVSVFYCFNNSEVSVYNDIELFNRLVILDLNNNEYKYQI